MKKQIVKMLSLLGGAIAMWLFLSLIITFIASSNMFLAIIISINCLLIAAGSAVSICIAIKFCQQLSKLFVLEDM